MKKTVVILMSIALLLSFAGCHNSTPSSSSSVITSPSSVSLTSSKVQSALSQTGSVSVVSSVDPSAMTATNGTPENHITYLHRFSYYGISYMKQGTQILSGKGGDEFDVFDKIDGVPEGEYLNKYYIKDMYEKGSEIPSAIKYLHPFLTNEFVSSNGNWDFFPTKVRYEKYTLENQPNNPEWDKYFMSRIKEESDETPLIYIDAWFFDWNKDGIEDSFVVAGNTFITSGDCTPNPPYYDKTVIYTMSVLFLSGNEAFETSGGFYSNISKEPLGEDNDVYTSYNTSYYSEGDPYWEDFFISAIQYGPNKNLIKCPIFYSGDYFRDEEDEMILCDIDGDGKAEFITTNIGIYSPMIVYKLIEGKPVEVFRVTTGA